MALDLKYGEIPITGIPTDEPVFVLRARDAAAVPTIGLYAAFCEQLGSPRAHVESSEDAAAVFTSWQRENATKVPD